MISMELLIPLEGKFSEEEDGVVIIISKIYNFLIV
jgi:hypothetical protein